MSASEPPEASREVAVSAPDLSDLRVALVRAFSLSAYKEPAEPIGIEALAAMLQKYGIAFRLFDREMTPRTQTVAEIAAYRPHVIGLSVLMEDNALDALRMLTQLRSLCPSATFAVGGLYVTTSYEKARARFPSYCELIAGEGELPLLRLCAALAGEALPIPQKPVLDPAEWPRLFRHNLRDYLKIGAPINMRGSRGCPGKCRFCATPFMPNGLDRWAARPVSDVADEMAALCARYRPHAFNFIDDDFGPLARVEELQSELRRRGLRCALSLQLRADAVCKVRDLPGVMRRLKDGGLCRVFIGLESFDRETLRRWGKPLDPRRALEAFHTIREAGVAIHIGYILWHPASTRESVRTEARMLWESGFFTTKIVMGKLQLFPGCGLQIENPALDRVNFPEEGYYNAVSQKIAPLYDAWLVGALDVPRQYCLAYLENEGDGECGRRVAATEEQLASLDALSYAVLMDCASVSDALIARTAARVKARLREVFGS